MRKKNRDIFNFIIFSWLQMAKDDLSVAKMETVPSFIRCYHSQQSMGKMLKAAFIVTYGMFCRHSEQLTQCKQVYPRKNKDSLNVPVPDCSWELDEDIQFPLIHDIVQLWERLRDKNANVFAPLNDKQRKFMNKASKYAVEYRYPYFLPKVGTQVGSIPNSEDVEEIVQAADQLYSDLDKYICEKAEED